MATPVNADTKDIIRGDIELYATTPLLAHIKPGHSFAINLRDQSKAGCKSDFKSLLETMSYVIRQKNWSLAEKGKAPHFTFHLETIGKLDPQSHCLIGYSLSLEQNHMRTSKINSEILNDYNHDNSQIIMKSLGVLHIDKNALDANLQFQLKLMMEDMIRIVSDVKSRFKNRSKYKK